jgi:hypothetical protein
MAGRNDLDLRPSDAALAAALRALPESAPQPDLWPELARSLGEGRRPNRWRYAIPAAIAAAITLAVLLPRLAPRDVEAPPATSVVSATAPNAPQSTPTAGELAQLHQRSRTLERWIAAVAARAPQDGRDLMAAVEVEDLIGLVDVQLGGASGDADTLPLWRQRVALLEDLAAIRGNAFALAENGASAEVPASLDTLN